MKDVFKTNTFDVIHCHLPNVSCFWILVLQAQLKGEKLILHWHSDVIGEKPHLGIKCLYPIYRIFEKSLLKKADSIVVTSQNYLNTSEPLKPYVKKCKVIPLGLDKETDEPSKELDFTVGILCVGRLTYYKGHEYLIRAMANIKSKQLPLTIVGDGEQSKHLRNLAKRLGIEKRIQFMGQVDDGLLSSLFKECEFLVLPSIERTEVFGLVLLEAMRARKACICTDVKGSGMSNVVLNGETGIVVQHESATALTDAIDLLSTNPVLNTVYGSNGKKRFETDFQIQCVEELVRKEY